MDGRRSLTLRAAAGGVVLELGGFGFVFLLKLLMLLFGEASLPGEAGESLVLTSWTRRRNRMAMLDPSCPATVLNEQKLIVCRLQQVAGRLVDKRIRANVEAIRLEEGGSDKDNETMLKDR